MNKLDELQLANLQRRCEEKGLYLHVNYDLDEPIGYVLYRRGMHGKIASAKTLEGIQTAIRKAGNFK